MTRWNWTWEEAEAPASDAGDALPHPPDWVSAGSPRGARVPRAAAFGLIAVVALVVWLAVSAGGHHARAHAPIARAAAIPPALPQPPGLDARENAAIDAVLARMPAVTQGGPNGHEVALTFDDGPGPYSEHLVGMLHRLHAPGTFFAIGEMERYFSAATRAQQRDGDVVGDHTQTHAPLASLSPDAQRLQLVDQAAEIGEEGLSYPRLFRPPYGSFNAATLRDLRGLHMLMVLWSTDTSDYQLPGVRAIVRRALQGAHPGAIILMHDGGGNRSETIAALPAIIKGLRRRGLTPVTVPRLLLDDPPLVAPSLKGRLAGD
jgi:peptidoglycan/xylan/chitin deacetylase (PgdA/CDA1 family)